MSHNRMPYNCNIRSRIKLPGYALLLLWNPHNSLIIILRYFVLARIRCHLSSPAVSPRIAMFYLLSCFSCLHLITVGSDERASIFVFEMRGFKRHLSGTAFPKKAAAWLEHCACKLHSCPLNTTLTSATLVISTLLMLPSFSWLFSWCLDTHDKTHRSSSLDHPLVCPFFLWKHFQGQQEKYCLHLFSFIHFPLILCHCLANYLHA